MKAHITIRKAKCVVANHINRRFGHKYDVWMPTKGRGVDLLVTRKRHRGRAVGLHVRSSRDYEVEEKVRRDMVAGSWITLDPRKVRESQAELWVFVIMPLKRGQRFIVIPTHDLRKRIPLHTAKIAHLYLWVLKNGSSYQVRGLPKNERLDAPRCGVRDPHRDFSRWVENWRLLDEFTEEDSR